MCDDGTLTTDCDIYKFAAAYSKAAEAAHVQTPDENMVRELLQEVGFQQVTVRMGKQPCESSGMIN